MPVSKMLAESSQWQREKQNSGTVGCDENNVPLVMRKWFW